MLRISMSNSYPIAIESLLVTSIANNCNRYTHLGIRASLSAGKTHSLVQKINSPGENSILHYNLKEIFIYEVYFYNRASGKTLINQDLKGPDLCFWEN